MQTAGLVAMIQSALIAAVARRAEQVDRLEARACRRMRGRAPEAAARGRRSSGRRSPCGRRAGGEPADLAPAHRVGLAGDRERAGAGLADAAGGEVAVDDRVDLVGAASRLVDALAEQA